MRFPAWVQAVLLVGRHVAACWFPTVPWETGASHAMQPPVSARIAGAVADAAAACWFPTVPWETGASHALQPPGSARIAGAAADVPLVQPTRTTCGSSVLVMMDLLDEGEKLGADPVAEFGRRALATMRRTNSWRDRSGHLQLAWPASLGTRPAALIRHLGGGWCNRVVDPRHPDRAWRAMQAAGRPVPLFIGEGSWMQHIVLVTAIDDDGLTVYDPACGEDVRRTRLDFETAHLRIAGWDQPWLTILPCR